MLAFISLNLDSKKYRKNVIGKNTNINSNELKSISILEKRLK
ncbi:hypothetical protein [Campylobacter fetus]|nr:hypothetical protein [Campylobacter fetus]